MTEPRMSDSPWPVRILGGFLIWVLLLVMLVITVQTWRWLFG